MAKFTSKSQMEELEDACTFGIEGGRINCSRNTLESKPEHTRRTTTTTKMTISSQTAMKRTFTGCLKWQAWRCGMEGDYISREAALEITTRTCGDYAAAFAEIRKLPAADVAEVVRCKNCK